MNQEHIATLHVARGSGLGARGKVQVPRQNRVTRTPRRPLPSCGFTLVELLVTGILLLVIGAAILTTFVSGQNSYFSSDAYIRAQQEARRALETMGYELRGGGGMPAVTGTTQVDFQVALGYAGGATTLGARDQNNVAQPNWRVRYRYDNGARQVLREVFDNVGALRSTRVLANDINAASFTWNGTDRTITMTIDARINNAFLPNQASGTGPLTSRVRVRN